jgi:putative FmdB family regulatory protein
MPIYEYKCNNCGTSFEKTQRITEEPLTECPSCQGEVHRVISKNIGVVFKGGGFYCTDVQRKKDQARALNKERQVDNQALLDGDVKSYVQQSESTDAKAQEA